MLLRNASFITARVTAMVKSLADAFPPYRRIEGRLVAKEVTPDGRYYILVQEEMVEVDSHTFDTLLEDENT